MTYVSTVLADSPVGYWRCKESSGNLADSGSANISAAAHGTITYGLAGVCDSDTAIKGDGSTGYFTAANDSTNVQGGSATIECWAKLPNNPAAYSGIMGFRNDTTIDFYVLQLQSTNNIECRYMGADGVAHTIAAFSVTSGAWHHFVARYDNGASSLECFVDGTSQGTVTTSGAFTTTTQSFFFGTEGGTNYTTATIGQVALYNVALSNARITAHFNAGNNYTPAAAFRAPPPVTLGQAVQRASVW